MTRDMLVQFAAIVFTTASLVFVAYVVGYLLFTWTKRQAAPETFEEFWDKLESHGAIYTEQEAEALYALYQARQGQVMSSIDRQKGS